jgi:hypothetical protein
MPTQRGLLRIQVTTAGSVRQAIGTLCAIEEAYLQIYAANILLERLNDTYFRMTKIMPPKVLIGIGYSWPLDAGFSFSAEEIRRRLLLAEDHLLISRIEISSPGFWEFLGALNPLEQFRKYLNDRHERKKDKEYRNKAEATKLRHENELLAVEVFSDRAQALKQVGFSDDDIRRILLPAAHALNNVAELQDDGLIETAELVLVEDKRPDGKKPRPAK